MTTRSPPDTRIRDGLRVLRTVAELHRRGYEQLRVLPYMAPSGMWWRCTLTPAGNFDTHDQLREHYGPNVIHTGNNDEFPFGWPDAETATARQLADLLERRHAELLRDAHQPDPAYKAWFGQMLKTLGRSHLPIAFADYELPWPDAWATVALRGDARRIPYPPQPRGLRAPGTYIT